MAVSQTEGDRVSFWTVAHLTGPRSVSCVTSVLCLSRESVRARLSEILIFIDLLVWCGCMVLSTVGLARKGSWEFLSKHIVIMVESCYFQCSCPVTVSPSEWYLWIHQCLGPCLFLCAVIPHSGICAGNATCLILISILNAGNNSRRVH